ncbi:MAG: response regulator, partial [Rhodospirillaceae bacterium]|nr:response regulator [Rhodospirillaceae bacterium]
NSAPDYSLMRVMLVDDNENFRTLVKTILKAAGITNIDCIASPLDAIDKLNDRPADVVLCDCVMDEMSGPAFAEKIKEMGIP